MHYSHFKKETLVPFTINNIKRGQGEKFYKEELEFNTICDHLNELISVKPQGVSDFKDLITYVKDRPGHDVRYAIDATKTHKELGYVPKETFETGINKTVEWYLQKQDWWLELITPKS